MSVNEEDDHTYTKFKIFERPTAVQADAVINASDEECGESVMEEGYP